MNDLSKFSTAALVDELGKRTGVQKEIVAPYNPYAIDLGDREQYETGPVVILIVVD